MLGATLPDTAFIRIKDSTSVKAAWEALRKLYEEKSRALVADLIRRFRNKRCEEGGNVRSHFEELADLREQLAGIGRKVDDEDYTDTLLASLPASYDGACTAISASAKLGSTKLTSDILQQLILDEYERRNVSSNGQKKDEAFNATEAKRRKKRDIECFNCKKRGHIKAECWAKGGGKEGQGPKRSGAAREKAAAVEEIEPEAWAAIEEVQNDDPAGAHLDSAVSAAATEGPRTGAGQSKETELYDSGA